MESKTEMRHKLYENFLKEFPLESLKSMPLERYTNLKRDDSFCYWVESRTYELGSIWGGASYKFGIYKYAKRPDNPGIIVSDEEYAWYKWYDAKDRYEAYKITLNSVVKIAELASNGKFGEIDNDKTLGTVLRWKIAFLYSNKQLIPIYKRKYLEDLATILGMNGASQASIWELQKFLINQKGDKDLFDYYDYLLSILPEEEKTQDNKTDTRVWLYAPGENARFWDECVANGKMYLGWDPLGDLSKYASREDMTEKMKEVYGADKSYTNDSLSTYDFVYTIKPGDIVYVKKGMHKIIGRGVVTGGYEYDAERKEYNNTRNVEWQNNGDWNVESQLVMKTLTDITKYPDLVASLQSLIDGVAVEVKDEPTDVPSGFWWLNANPKYWSMSEWTVGAEQFYTLLNENGRKRRIYQNFVNAKEGDVVICYESNPTKQILCLATVSKASDGERIYFKKVETLANGIDYATFKDVPELQQMEYLVNPNGSFFKLTAEEYDVLMDIIRESNPIAPAKATKLYTKENFLEDVYISSSDYDALCGVLEHKKNIIFQGAPGVGKTFSAKRLAYSIMGEVDDDRIGFVQFHQNYSYEDFVMGYKPNSEGGFDLQRGIFYKFCIKAANDPNRPYFFIIDEINRGNLSKIFGELLMLIEKDYRFDYKEGKGTKITLAYSDERFAVPANLYIIGMMNTADRSLAMIDYALRRRFSFYPMKPGFDSDGFKQYQEELGNEKFNALIEKVKELNKAIVDDGSLGSGFEIGHSYFCNQEEVADSWLRAVVNYEIIPMLEEYWFDNKDKVEEWSEKLKKAIND
jgi:hypothetical protein